MQKLEFLSEKAQTDAYNAPPFGILVLLFDTLLPILKHEYLLITPGANDMFAKAINYLACVAVVFTAALPVLYAADVAGSGGLDAITKPSQDVILSFDRPGRIAELPVKEQDLITKGQLVARQEDSEEEAALNLAKITADDDTAIKAEQAVLDQKRKDLDNLQHSGSSSHYELDQATLEVRVEEAKVVLQKFQQRQNEYKYEQAKAAFEKTRLLSPIDGIVQETMIKVGESVDVQNMKVVRIVNLDPLRVEVAVPFAQAQQLHNGDPAQVTLSNKEVRDGRVTMIASVAEAGSGSLLLWVELPNPNHRRAGEQVHVSFPSVKVAADQP